MRIHLASTRREDWNDVNTVFPDAIIDMYPIRANKHESFGSTEAELSAQYKIDELRKRIQKVDEEDMLIAIEYGVIEITPGAWYRVPHVIMSRRGRQILRRGESGIPVKGADLTNFFPCLEL